MKQLSPFLLLGLSCFFAAFALVGCRRVDDRPFPVTFEENLVHAKKWEIQSGVSMDQTIADVRWTLEELFGTPDEPKLPRVITEDEDLAELLSPAHLIAASGPPGGEGRGLYRQHCERCHGVTGNGRGETAALVDPYPRDFRNGIFKFKSTSRGAKPLKADLARVIKHGIPGTAMVAEYQLTPETLAPLPDDAVAALVDYVIYLSMRGEVERALFNDAAMELDLEGGERLVDPALRESDPAEFEEQWELIEEPVEDIASTWLDAEDALVEVEVPDDLPLPRSEEEMAAMLAGEQGDVLRQSIEQGRVHFVGAIASCSKCHGPGGAGDGQEADYDDWTKDWTVRIGLKPDDRAALVSLMARGALPPRTIRPRNFQEGLFRGGDWPEDLYRRIVAGIDGTPMPGVTLVPGQFEERDIWHLINFIRSLQFAPPPAESESESGP